MFFMLSYKFCVAVDSLVIVLHISVLAPRSIIKFGCGKVSNRICLGIPIVRLSIGKINLLHKWDSYKRITWCTSNSIVLWYTDCSFIYRVSQIKRVLLSLQTRLTAILLIISILLEDNLFSCLQNY